MFALCCLFLFHTLKKTAFEICCNGGDDKEAFFVSLDKDDKQLWEGEKRKWFSDGGEKFHRTFYVFYGLEIFVFSCVIVSKKRAGAGPSMILLIMDKKKGCKSQSDSESFNLYFILCCSFL